MNTTTLMTDVPAETLLGLGILFGTAAIVLLALSTEAGNYPEFRQGLRAMRHLLPRLRRRRRWHFPTTRPAELA